MKQNSEPSIDSRGSETTGVNSDQDDTPSTAAEVAASVREYKPVSKIGSMRRALEALDLSKLPVKRDGNCCPNAIKQTIGVHVESHMPLRREVATFLRTPSAATEILKAVWHAHTLNDEADYVMTSGNWYSSVHIHATAMLSGRTIVVVTTIIDAPVTVYPKELAGPYTIPFGEFSPEAVGSDTIVLGLMNDHFYGSVKRPILVLSVACYLCILY